MSDEFETVIAEYYQEKFKLIDSIEVDDTRHLVEINVLVSTKKGIPSENSRMGKLIGRKGIVIIGLEEKIREEFGDEWKVRIVKKNIDPN